MAVFTTALRLLLHFFVALCLVNRLELELDEASQSETPSDGITLFEMPNAPWERRYFRQSFTQGLEVFLVRRVIGNRWLVLKPDLNFGTISLTAKTTILPEASDGVLWERVPVLTEVQKVDYVRRGADMVSSGAHAGLELPLYRPGRQVREAFVAQAAVLCFSWPSGIARWLRWGLRSRRRFVGIMAALTLGYFFLQGSGFITGIITAFDLTRDLYILTKQWAIETSEYAVDVFSWFEEWYAFFSVYVTLRQGICVIFAFLLVVYVWIMEGDESSVTSSRAPSEVSDSGLGASGTSLVDADSAVRSLRQTIEKQSGLINDLLLAQQSMKQELADQQTAVRAAEIRKHASQPEETGLISLSGGGLAPRGTDAVAEMMKRLDGFEDMLRQHAPSSSPQDAIVVVQSGLSQSSSSPAAPAPIFVATGKTVNDPEKKTKASDAIQRALNKMKVKSQKVSDVFARQLEQYAEVDVELWHAHFPVGYRERLAGEFVAEIVSTDKTLEAWSRDFLRDRELLDCFPARELIATCSAMDSMILTDMENGLLNKVGFERLARKAYGLVQAFKLVQGRNDWMKPKSAPQGWKSKVDWSAARQYDPSFRSEGVPIVMGAEEEVRKEQEREAALLKARSKLAEHGGSSTEAPNMGS